MTKEIMQPAHLKDTGATVQITAFVEKGNIIEISPHASELKI